MDSRLSWIYGTKFFFGTEEQKRKVKDNYMKILILTNKEGKITIVKQKYFIGVSEYEPHEKYVEKYPEVLALKSSVRLKYGCISEPHPLRDDGRIALDTSTFLCRETIDEVMDQINE